MAFIRAIFYYLFIGVGLLVIGLPFMFYKGVLCRRWADSTRICIPFFQVLFKLSGIKVEIEGKENIPDHKKFVLIANHQSFLDINVIWPSITMTSFIAKAELWKIPVFGWVLTKIGCIPVHRNPRKNLGMSVFEKAFHVFSLAERHQLVNAFAHTNPADRNLQKLQKVFSMPLGVNDITLAEISTAYQTLLTGKVFKCLDGDWTDPCFIKEIKNRDGKVIFRNKSESKVVLGDSITSQIAVMLHSVFTNGTARSQYTHITVTSPDKAITLRYPALGKTGTTNDYRNVAFLGALPTYVNEKNGISTDSVIAIGSYVGFDDNKPLKSGRTRIAGASGRTT